MYGEEIDEYLQNRPHPLIRHCLLKKNLGENLDLTGIRVTATGKFSVIYYRDGQRRLYNVDSGSDAVLLLPRLENFSVSMQKVLRNL